MFSFFFGDKGVVLATKTQIHSPATVFEQYVETNYTPSIDKQLILAIF